jgi:hypothetical protein
VRTGWPGVGRLRSRLLRDASAIAVIVVVAWTVLDALRGYG